MAAFNKVILAGNLTRDPETRYTPKGTAISKCGLAINRSWTGDDGEKKEEVTFVDVDFFGRTAETVGQYLKKGSPILIEGRLRLETWQDKQTQQNRQRLSIVGEHFQFLDAATRDTAKGSNRGTKPATSAPAAKEAPAGEVPEDDVTF